jgi:glucokinase
VTTARPSRENDGAPPAGCGPFVAADVGGTHVRIGLVGVADGRPEVLRYEKYACADFPGLAEVIAHFLAGMPADPPVRGGVIACAGHPAPDGSLLAVNLPWPVSIPAIRARLGFARLELVNDFEAVAYAVGHADTETLLHLSGPASAPTGPVLVVGPGTGLGAAVRIPARGGAVVLATEAGQAALTVRDELEMALLREFLRHVSVEHALSGPGLVRLHHVLARVRGVGTRLDAPAAISAAARTGGDALARETLDVFCALLGSAVGDMALLYGAHGGVHLAGGVLPQIRDFLPCSAFVQRFLDKGPMRQALERIPVTLVEHGQLGVLGAANWYVDRHGFRHDQDRGADSPAACNATNQIP